jgi:predicted dehydrogenase
MDRGLESVESSGVARARAPGDNRRMSSSDLSRRTFCAGLGAAATLGWGRSAPSDQVSLAMIGVGNQGTGRLREFLRLDNVRIAAICDLDRRHAERAAALVAEARGTKPPIVTDFRRLLAMKEVDAVAVVTPDHWHAIPAVTAMAAGKDVFCEKPLSYTVQEGRAMADLSARQKRVTQMGNHIHNTGGNYRRAVEIVKSGKLGAIHRVHLWKTGPDKNFTTAEPPTVPDGFDYDFWQGPAPRRPYEPLRSHLNFRYFWDYSGGVFIDFWCHISDLAFWALGLEAAQTVAASGGRFVLTDRTECPDSLEVVMEFPKLLYQFSLRPTPLPGFEHMGNIGCLFEGSEASLVANYSTHEVWVRGKRVADFAAPPETIPPSPGHLQEWVSGIQSRNLDTTCNFRYGHQLSKHGLLANIALRTGRKLKWDDGRERFVADADASRYLRREYRRPWKLKG